MAFYDHLEKILKILPLVPGVILRGLGEEALPVHQTPEGTLKKLVDLSLRFARCFPHESVDCERAYLRQALLTSDSERSGDKRYRVKEDTHKGVAGTEIRLRLVKLGFCLIELHSHAFKLLPQLKYTLLRVTLIRAAVLTQ